MRAWWFQPANGVLGYDDNRKPIKGRTHKVSGRELELCLFGLHASKRPLDALGYACSSTTWRVELSGDVLLGDDKSCATERTYLWRLDAEAVLRKFGRLCALDVVDQWDAPDVVLRWLKTGDESIRDAARSAANSAANYAPNHDARSAARSAADYAAYSAARSAARSAADYAATQNKQNTRLHGMLMQAHGEGR